MKKLISLLLSMGLTLASFAQTGQLKGKVVDKLGKTPLEGAYVYINNSQRIVTDKNGEFTIPCADSVLIKVTFTGYIAVQQSVSCLNEVPVEIALLPVAHNLETVEISASFNTHKSPWLLRGPIVKLEVRELKRATGLYLDDAINTNVPGVFMQRRTQSGGQQINIRGYGNGMGFRGVSNNFDGQGVKMYLNGIPITDAEGITVMDDLDNSSVANIEVLKGPSGTLYGLAIAGVINLQTEQAPLNKYSIGQDVITGSYGLLKTTTGLSIGGSSSSLLVNYGRQQFKGFMEHTRSDKHFVNLIGNFRLSEKQKITTYFGYANSYDERNGELTKEQFNTSDYSGNTRYIKNDAHSAVTTLRAGTSHTYRFNGIISNTTTIFGSSQNITQSSAGGWTDKLPLNYGLRSVFTTAFELSKTIMLSGITGLEAQKMNAQTIGYGMSADSTDPDGYNIITSLRSNQASSNSTFSYFTQWILGLPVKLSITAGVGVSRLNLQLEDRLWGLNYNQPTTERFQVYQSRYSRLVSPAFAINKKINEVASVYASYSTGYKAPVSSNILIATTGSLNTGLKPEKGTQFETGTRGSLLHNKLYYSAAVFNARYKDKLTSITVQNPENSVTLYSYLVNGGRLNNNGVELFINYKAVESNTGFIKFLQPFANFTYSDFKYEDYQFERIGKNAASQDSTISENYSGKKVAGVSPVVFNMGIDLDTRIGIYGNTYYNFRSSMPYTSDGLNETNAYSLLNAKIGFRKRIKHFDLNIYAGANNITGTRYYHMVFVNQLPDAYIPAPNEINFYGGATLKYTL